jgi:hypothetical protein
MPSKYSLFFQLFKKLTKIVVAFGQSRLAGWRRVSYSFILCGRFAPRMLTSKSPIKL